jgi:hypothetical protein
MTLTKQNIVRIAVIVAAIAFVAMTAILFARSVHADAFAFGQKSYLTPGAGTLSQAGAVEASTTVTYLRTSDTASTSITAFVGDSGSVHIDLQIQGSSTASVLNQYRYFSDNGIDWYAEDLTTVSSNVLVAHASTTPVRTWQPSTTVVTRKHMVIDTNAKYVKIDFGVTGGNASLYAVAVPKQETPN